MDNIVVAIGVFFLLSFGAVLFAVSLVLMFLLSVGQIISRRACFCLLTFLFVNLFVNVLCCQALEAEKNFVLYAKISQ